MRSIVFVCSGNTCRSPMAEFAAKYEFFRRGITAQVCSRGIYCREGSLMSANSRAVLEKAGIEADIGFFSRSIADCSNDDTFVCVTESHAAAVRDIFTGAEVLVMQPEIPDPFGGDMEDYEKSFEMIMKNVRALADMLKREQDKNVDTKT